MLLDKYGKEIYESNVERVDPKLIVKLSVRHPEAKLVNRYLEAIAQSYGVPYTAKTDDDPINPNVKNHNHTNAAQKETNNKILLKFDNDDDRRDDGEDGNWGVSIAGPMRTPPPPYTPPPKSSSTSSTFNSARLTSPYLPVNYAAQNEANINNNNSKDSIDTDPANAANDPSIPEFDDLARRFAALKGLPTKKQP